MILRVEQITKRFPGVTALDDVSFDLRPGEIHALCGENGAGKSTLIKLLAGIHAVGSYDGRLEIDGCEARFASPADATAAGIAVIYQEPAMVDEMNVAENIFLGCELRRRRVFVDRAEMVRRARAMLDRFGIDLDPEAVVGSLGVGQKQSVEIVKALAKEARILVLDEPTAALAEHETRRLMEILCDLRRRGIACIYVSHRLEEVFTLADRITVLRDGATVGTWATSTTTPAEVIRRMVGRELGELYPPPGGQVGPLLLEVSGLSVADDGGAVRLCDVDFDVRAGEVVGIGGLMGSGRTDLLMHLFGAWGRRTAGRVRLDGRELPPNDPRRMLRAGAALVGEDRRRYGLVLDRSIEFNLSLSSLGRCSRFGWLCPKVEAELNRRWFDRLRVKAVGLQTIVGRLSGGNQQKVVVGKALMSGPKVVLLDEPTRGIDVGAKREIYEVIRRLTDEGKGVLLVSSELPELIGLCDRIIVLGGGRVVGRFDRRTATPEAILQAAIGNSVTSGAA